MKRLIAVIVSIFVLASCEGTTGPQGPPGQDGVNIVGQGFEVTANFNADNDYSQLFYFDEHNAEVINDDVVVVYLKFGEDNSEDIWQPLPATYYLEDDSQVQYGFENTLVKANIFLGGNTDFSTLDPIYTENQIFRIAILPVDDVEANNIDLSNMKQVMGAMGDKGFQKVNIMHK